MLRTAFLVAIICNVVYNLIKQKQKLTEAGRTLPLSIAYASEKELSNDFNQDFSIDEQQAETDGAQDTAQLEKEDATACNKQDETSQYEPKRLLPQSRNATFDVARIIAMFLIVASHFLGHGGWMNNMSGTNLVFAKILQSVFYPAVDVFVLTSAYFSCTKTKLNVKKLATLYATVWFYSMLLFTVATASGMIPYNQGQLISSIFPVLTGKYWFFPSRALSQYRRQARFQKATSRACDMRVDSRLVVKRRSYLAPIRHRQRIQPYMVRVPVLCRILYTHIRRQNPAQVFCDTFASLRRVRGGRIFCKSGARVDSQFARRGFDSVVLQAFSHTLEKLVEGNHRRIVGYVRRVSDTRQQRNARVHISKRVSFVQILLVKVLFSHSARLYIRHFRGVRVV